MRHSFAFGEALLDPVEERKEDVRRVADQERDANGGKLSPIVKLLNNPTALPPIAAMMKRAFGP